MSFHRQLLEKLKPSLESVLEGYNGEEGSDEFLLHQLFKNFRANSGRDHGLRLSYFGLVVMRKHYEVHQYPNVSINNKTILKMDKAMRWPYYVSATNVAFFSTDDAAWFKLNGGDLESFADQL